MRAIGNPLFALAFLLALVCLVSLGPETGYGDQAIRQTNSAAATPCDENFCLTKSQTGQTWHLVYRFKGLHDQWHEVSCAINELDSKRLRDSFGYHDSERTASWPKYLEKTINLAARLSPNSFEYGEARVKETGIYWQPVRELPPLVGEKLIASEQTKFAIWYMEKEKELVALTKEKFLQDHGFMTIPKLGEVPDYSSIVLKSGPVLRNCAEAFDRATGGEPELLQAFFQSMFYNKISMNDGGKRTGGLSLPPTVMIQGIGDCDSKAAAFCAIQRKRRLVILRSLPGDGSPQHALVGVEAWKKNGHDPNETWAYKTIPEALKAILYGDPIRIGLRDYWPCEVAGRKRIAFGQVDHGHEGRYVAIRIQ